MKIRASRQDHCRGFAGSVGPLSIDRGSVGKEHSTFLLKKIRINGTQTYDIFHIFQSNLDAVFTACESDFAKKESSVAYNAGHAPYGAGQLHQQFKGCSKEFYKLPWDNEFFYTQYQSICRSLEIPTTVMQDPTHRSSLWQWLGKDSDGEAVGRVSRLGRLVQWYDSHDIYKPRRPSYVMTITFMGVKRSWYPHISKSPLRDAGVETFEIADAGPDVALPGPSDGDDEAGGARNRKRQRSK